MMPIQSMKVGTVVMVRALSVVLLALCLLGPTGCGGDENKDKVCREGRHQKACEKFGRCVRGDSTMGGTFCHAAKADDCRASTIACKEQGRCGASDEKEPVDCIVVSEEDCANSDGCKINGFCGLKKDSAGKNICVATKSEHCRKSEQCTKEFKCHLGEDSCYVGHMRPN